MSYRRYSDQVVIQPVFRTQRYNPGAWDTTDLLQQAFIESKMKDHWVLTAGKKAEFNGAGFIFSPSDLLNEGREVFDPLYQNDGVVFTRIKYLFGASSSVGVGYIPVEGQNVQDGKPWLTGTTEIAGIDLRAQYTDQTSEKSTFGLSAQRFFGDVELHFDGRYQTKQRFQTASADTYMQFSSYAGPNPYSNSDDLASGFYLAGARYVLSQRRTLVFEVLDQQSGLLPEQFALYYAKLEADAKNHGLTYQQPTQLEGRHYVFGAYHDDQTRQGLHLEANVLENLDDKSLFAAFVARAQLSPLTSVELAPTYYTGGVNTEFGGYPFAQLIYLTFRGRF